MSQTMPLYIVCFINKKKKKKKSSINNYHINEKKIKHKWLYNSLLQVKFSSLVSTLYINVNFKI